MEPKTFQQFRKDLNQPINCLADQERDTRKKGLQTITNTIKSNISSEHLVRLLVETNLSKYLIRVFSDKIQRHREMALEILEMVISKLQNQKFSKDDSEPFVRALIHRVNATPFPEVSEELRLKIIQLLNKMLDKWFPAFIGNLSEVANALSKCLLDPYAEIKKASCALIEALCLKFRSKNDVSASSIGEHSTAICKSLSQNLTHQHSRVRKVTLVTLGRLLVTAKAGSNFEHVQIGVKAALSDNISEVRKAALQCSAQLLKYFAPAYLKPHEATLVSYLLTGLNDENKNNVEKAKELLEDCGNTIYHEENTMDEESQGLSQMVEEK